MVTDDGLRDPVRQAVGAGGQFSGRGVARQLGELSREMQAEPTTGGLLRRIVAAAVTEIPGAEHAGITFFRHGVFSTPVATGDLVIQVDALQYSTGQGPCLAAAARHTTVRSDDLRSDRRWPEFGWRAAALGVRSMLSFQLFVEADSLGALNLYAAAAAAFSEESESTGMLLAAHAAIAMTAAGTEEGLRLALDGRDVIGQAKGILMERHKISDLEAFAVLVAASQAANQKLRMVAEHLASTGELPKPQAGGLAS